MNNPLLLNTVSTSKHIKLALLFSPLPVYVGEESGVRGTSDPSITPHSFLSTLRSARFSGLELLAGGRLRGNHEPLAGLGDTP